MTVRMGQVLPNVAAVGNRHVAQVRSAGGAAPALQSVAWGTNVLQQLFPRQPLLHFANMGCYQITGNRAYNKLANDESCYWTYSPRTAGMLPAGSAIAVQQCVQAETRATLDYLASYGLASADIHVLGLAGNPAESLAQLGLQNVPSLTRDLSALGMSPQIFPFIGSRAIVQLAHRLGLRDASGQPRVTTANVQAVDTICNKGKFAQILGAAGVAIAPGEWLHGVEDLGAVKATYQRLKKPGQSVFLKLCISASGKGVFELESLADLEAALAHPNVLWQLKTPGVGILLDQEVVTDHLPNVMVYIGDTPAEDRLINVSDQILVKNKPSDRRATVHTGNVSLSGPALHLALQPVPDICNAMRAQGFRGVAGIDLALDMQKGRSIFLEVNARLNGNNGASFIGIGAGEQVAWGASNSIVVPKGISLQQFVAHLHAQKIHYDPRSGLGVFAINASTSRFGNMQVGVRGRDEADVRAMLLQAAM